ncbi:MAG TPA: penicillin-binding protein 2 [Myxococcus sp.]|nr:penicillin-binding protein 2 [Myxococcus sp.]
MTTLGQDSSGRDLKKRIFYLALSMMGALGLLVIRLYQLQITRGEEYAAKSMANFVKEVRLRADRGVIKDARGTILVGSRPSFDAFVTPAFCTDCYSAVLPNLGRLLGWDEAHLQQAESLVRRGRHNGPFQPVPVAVDLQRDEFDRVAAQLGSLDGVTVEAVPRRNYRTGPVLSHVLGYMNEINTEELERLNGDGARYAPGDYIGRRGLERYFELKLRGQDGVRREVVNARGQTIEELNGRLGPDTVTPPTPGANLVLSIDMRLQEAAERAFPGVAGSVVAVDVRTGFIRAIVSRPGFDPNLLTGRITAAQMAALTRDPLQPMVNRAAANHYSPGSTFKVVTALAAFKSGQFRPETRVFCDGGYELGTRAWRCHKDAGHGDLDAKGALQVSCNTWFYKVADTLGLNPIAEMGKALGLGQPTGVGVLAEVPGIMPTQEYHEQTTQGGYSKGLALNSAVGQGDDNVTPLQLAMLYAAIANGGTLYKPQLVERLEAPGGEPLETYGPEVVRRMELPEAHRKVLVDALEAVVNEVGGTAYAKRLVDVRVAGKTGTAQVARIGAVRLKTQQMDYFQRHHAWFAGFAPAEAPELAVVVLNEHGGQGGSDAAPTAMAVFQKYFELKRAGELDGPVVRGARPYKPEPALQTQIGDLAERYE